MTGKVDLLDPLDSSGRIKMESGSSIPFKLSALVAYDMSRIAVGQLVTFDLKDGHPEAINVCIRAIPDGRGSVRSAAAHTRYAGFEHHGNIRTYRFELVALGQAIQTISFRVDLTLMAKHKIVIQDGLDLCGHVLLSKRKEFDSSETRLHVLELGDSELAAYRASHPVPGKAKHAAKAVAAQALPVA